MAGTTNRNQITLMLFDFNHKDAVEPWQSIDDRVMGGVSQSELISDKPQGNARAIFRGSVSLKNNGGFCSVRAALQDPIKPDFKHLWIRCNIGAIYGDKTYYLNVRTDNTFDGVNYRTVFLPGEASKTFEFTSCEFTPVFRGRGVTDAPALQLSDIRQIGLMIADAQAGAFELFVNAIGLS